MKRNWLWIASAAVSAAVMAGQPALKNLKLAGGDRSLTLDEAVAFAVEHNPNILIAEQEIARTQGLVIQVRAEALPQIVLSGDYTQEDPRLLHGGGGIAGGGSTNSGAVSTASGATSGASTTTTNPSSSSTGGSVSSGVSSTGGTAGSSGSTGGTAGAAGTSTGGGASGATTSGSSSGTTSGGGTTSSDQNKSWGLTIEASQLLYSGGQVSAALKIAHLTETNSFFTLRDTVDSVIDSVRKQFYTVLLDRALITVQEESVRLLADQLKDQQSRFEAGTVPRFNVLQAEVALINQKPVLIQARNNYKVAKLTLARLMNIDFDPSRPDYVPFEVVGDLSVHVENFDLNAALEQAKQNRWSLKVQRQLIDVYSQNIRVQLAGYQPRLSVDGGYELHNNELSDSLGKTLNGYFFGVTGDWAIFDGGATYGLVKQARAQFVEARVTYEDAVHQVELQVQQAFLALEVARETLDSQTKGVEEAVEALRLASERLTAGAGTQLDVLNSQVALTTARSTELQARASYLEAMADFDEVTAVETKWAQNFDDPSTRRKQWGLRSPNGHGTQKADIYSHGRRPARPNAD